MEPSIELLGYQFGGNDHPSSMAAISCRWPNVWSGALADESERWLSLNLPSLDENMRSSNDLMLRFDAAV